MKWKMLRLFFEPDNGATGGAPPPAAPPPSTPPAGDPPPPPPAGGSAPPPAPPPSTPPAGEKPPAAAPKPTILGAVKDDGQPPPAPPGEKPPATPPAAPDAKAVTDFIGGLKVDYGQDAEGKPLPADAKALERIAPLMLKHGVTPEAASEIIQADVAYRQELIAAWQKQNDEVAARMAEATEKELGNDLPRFAAEAVRGGRYLFGDDLWNELKAVPHFSNDVRVVKALAALGRSLKNDPGPGGAGGGNFEPNDFADRWINSSNRGKE
jgi:hypothetical protein